MSIIPSPKALPLKAAGAVVLGMAFFYGLLYLTRNVNAPGLTQVRQGMRV